MCIQIFGSYGEVIPKNPKKTLIEGKIRGFDLDKGSTKNHPPLCGTDIRIRYFLQRGGYPQVGALKMLVSFLLFRLGTQLKRGLTDVGSNNGHYI